MDLDYRFKFQLVFPKEIWDIEECGGLLRRSGLAPSMPCNRVAAFTDPATALALWLAGEPASDVLLTNGWSLLPAGAINNEEHTLFVAERLREIWQKAAAREIEKDQARRAVFKLHALTKMTVTGEAISPAGGTMTDVVMSSLKTAIKPGAPFLVQKALMGMIGNPVG